MHYKERFKQLKSYFYGIDPGLTQFYYRHFYTPRKNAIAHIINERAKGINPFYFLQIGGNDGFVRDPVFKFVKKYRWRGIIVEPQQEVFHKRLTRTYRNEPHIILENVAIGQKSEIRKLYKIAFTSSRWATGLATFDRKTLEHHIDRGYVANQARREGIPLPENRADYITYEEVTCTTIPDLLSKHNIGQLNLLQIDTEGYDYEIIKTIDFGKIKPGMISFESEHLSADDLSACKALLQRQGYMVKQLGRDAIASLSGI